MAEKGEKGDTGATGHIGPTGVTGAVGAEGRAGTTGIAGAAGAAGAAGVQGEQGASYDDSELAAALKQFVDSRHVLHDAVQLVSDRQVEDRQASKRRRVLGGIVAGAVLVATFFAGRYLISIAEQNRENGRLLIDCTTPGPRKATADDFRTGHKCYDDGSSRTRAAVTAIVEGITKSQADASKAEGAARIAEVDCRTREALAGLPPTPYDKSCVEAHR